MTSSEQDSTNDPPPPDLHDNTSDNVSALRRKCQMLTQELRTARLRFDLILEATNDGVWDWDLTTNECMFSRRWKGILSYRDDEIENVASAFFSLVHEQDATRVQEAVNNHLQNRQPYDIEFRMRAKSGEYRLIRARGQALWSDDGTPLRMAGTHSDVTQQRTEQQAHLQAQELIDLQRKTIEALGTPILDLGNGILCLPIIGAVNSVRANSMTTTALEHVARRSAQLVIVDLTAADVTGVETLVHLSSMLKSIRLLGAAGVLCGIQPTLAQTMTDQQLSMDGVRVFRTLGQVLQAFDL